MGAPGATDGQIWRLQGLSSKIVVFSHIPLVFHLDLWILYQLYTILKLLDGRWKLWELDAMATPCCVGDGVVITSGTKR